tara:strand:+ start:399 stop:875 length:477 start_codon:yes stop_codon:yes gene_type:complete
MKKIILIIIICLILYSLCYFIFPEEISILQFKKNKLNIDNLLLKQPIVIEDHIDMKFINNIFNNNKIIKFNSNNLWERTPFKYTLLYANNNTNIFISNPKKFKYITPTEDDTVIDIKLNKNQSIIIPFKWYYSLNKKEDILIYGIHDYITLFFSFLFN